MVSTIPITAPRRMPPRAPKRTERRHKPDQDWQPRFGRAKDVTPPPIGMAADLRLLQYQRCERRVPSAICPCGQSVRGQRRALSGSCPTEFSSVSLCLSRHRCGRQWRRRRCGYCDPILVPLTAQRTAGADSGLKQPQLARGAGDDPHRRHRRSETKNVIWIAGHHHCPAVHGGYRDRVRIHHVLRVCPRTMQH